MVECGGLENRLALFGSRGFESLLLRQSTVRVPATGRFSFGRTRRGFEPEGREKPNGFSRAETWESLLLRQSTVPYSGSRQDTSDSAFGLGILRFCHAILSSMEYPLTTSDEGIIMQNENYFSRSWAMLTRDKGWIKPLLVMAAASLVPVVGEFGNNGYALEWARLTAWGVDSAPKQKNVDVGKCVTSGARAFVVSLGWGFICGIAVAVLNGIFSIIPGAIGQLFSAMMSLALSVVMSIVSIAIMVAQLRTTIYEKIGAGYQPKRIYELISSDTRGFLRVFLIQFVSGLIIGAIITVFIIVCMLFFMPILLRLSGGYVDSDVIVGMLAGMIFPLVVVCALFGYVISFVANAVRMLVVNALGLWMRQFDVPNWGRSEDPLPTTPGTQANVAQQWQQPMQTQGGQPGAYGQPMQQAPMQQPMQQSPAQAAEQAEQVYRAAQQEAATLRDQMAQQQVAPQQQPQVEAQPEAMQQQTQQVQSQPEEAPQPEVAFQQPEQPEAEPAPQQQVAADDVSEQLPPTISLEPKASKQDDQTDAEDLYESMSEAIRENDRVEGD